MRTVFLADAHLNSPCDPNYRLLVQFLEGLQGTVDTLCILGDLFDFRVGLPALDFPEQDPVLKLLARLSKSGLRLIYLEGNHDFQLGAAFAAQIGAELYRGPVTLTLQGKRLFLCHGDLVNRADWRYRLLYRLLRNPVLFSLARLMPASLVQAVRYRLQYASKRRYSKGRSQWNYREIITAYGEEVRQQGCDALVLGHFHLPFLEQRDQFCLLAVGDWITQFSYGELRDGRFFLSTYQP